MGVKTTSDGAKSTLEKLVDQDFQEEEGYGVESQEDRRYDPGGMGPSRIQGQDQQVQDHDCSPPGVDGDPPPPPQPGHDGGMAEVEQAKSPNTGV